MNTRIASVLHATAAVAAATLFAIASAHSAPTEGTAKTNAPAASLQIPRSVFIIPTNSSEGRNPFFPRSTRLSGGMAPKTSSEAVVLVLNGLSEKVLNGVSEKLAMINGQTFGAGEEGEVRTTIGRKKIRCIEIKADVVVIEVDGERRELRLRPGN